MRFPSLDATPDPLQLLQRCDREGHSAIDLGGLVRSGLWGGGEEILVLDRTKFRDKTIVGHLSLTHPLSVTLKIHTNLPVHYNKYYGMFWTSSAASS